MKCVPWLLGRVGKEIRISEETACCTFRMYTDDCDDKRTTVGAANSSDLFVVH